IGVRRTRNVRKQCGVDRKQASNELRTGMHNSLSWRSKRSKRQSTRASNRQSSRCRRSRQTPIPTRHQSSENCHRHTANGPQRRGWLANQRQHHRDNTWTLEQRLPMRLQGPPPPPLFVVEGVFEGENSTLQFLSEKWHTMPKVFS